MSEEKKEQLSVSSQQSAVSGEQQPPSSLRDTGPLQGESLEDTGKMPVIPAQKTQGVRAQRTDAGKRVLERAAKSAARTGRRADVHEYMRIRRNFV